MYSLITASIKVDAGLPWGCVATPFEDKASVDVIHRQPQLKQPPARCDTCLGYVNPWCRASGSGYVVHLWWGRFARAERWTVTDGRCAFTLGKES